MEKIFKLFYNSLEKPINVKGILLIPNIEEDKIDSYRMAEMIKRAKALKRDGVIYKTPSMGDTYVVFKPEQIKSVYNKGAFERANKNIYANIQRPPRNFRGQDTIRIGERNSARQGPHACGYC